MGTSEWASGGGGRIAALLWAGLQRGFHSEKRALYDSLRSLMRPQSPRPAPVNEVGVPAGHSWARQRGPGGVGVREEPPPPPSSTNSAPPVDEGRGRA